MEMTRPKVLYVEDNLDDAWLVQELLEERYSVKHFGMLGDAISHIEEGNNFDACLLDLNLPDSQGITTLHSLLAAAPTLSVVVFTGDSAANKEISDTNGVQSLHKTEEWEKLLQLLALVTNPSSTKPQKKDDGQTIELLYVEDNEDDLAYLKESLPEKQDVLFSVHHANTVNVAVDLLQQRSFDVALVDLSLPDATHFDAVQTLRKYKQEMPIIVLTGAGDEEVALEALRKGAQDFLLKSEVTGNQVARAVRYTLERRRLQERQKELERQVQITQRMKAIGELAGGIAHDFNNLLQVVHGFCEMASASIEEDHIAQEDLESALQAVTQAGVLARKLLVFGKKQPSSQIVIDINAHLANLERLIRGFVPENILLQFMLTPEPLGVEIDPSEFEQVILNLVSNARDAIIAGGKITISLGSCRVEEDRHPGLPAGEYCELRITDTGTGIPPKLQQRIFDPFFTTKSSKNRTGLGLSSCYGIIRAHQGMITLQSEVGVGTTFSILLPRVPAPEAIQRPAIPAQETPEKTPGTILLAEDNHNIRSVFANYLMRKGHSVLQAADGNEALDAINKHGHLIDLIVTDIIMPGPSGIKVTQYARERHPKLPALYISGYAADELEQPGINLSDEELLQKPFSLSTFLKAVEDKLSTQKAD